ncbi:MAG: fibrinogen-like YCDxxxxGGGW domain-containing protein, partial [Candidatus Absconditabacteria bacterium]
YVSQEGQISLKETKSYNCEEMIMSTVDMGQTVGVCSGLTPTFDLMSQSSLLSQGINYGEEQMCGGTLPEFAELNGIEKTGKEWQYNTESGECNFKCMDSYYYSDGICKSYNCSVTSTQVNNHNYYVDAMLNGQILPVLSEYMPIENGKSQYKQSFQCNTNNLTPTGGETIIDTVCNNGFIKVGNNCINQPTSKSCSETLSQNPDSMNGMYWIDPDLEGGNLPVEVYCDMGNGGWTRVQYENFETGSTSGWTNNRLTRCSSYGYILGGYGVLGRVNNSKTYNLKGVPHTQVKATMNYMFIDSWDGERGDVYLGGTRIFSMNMDTHTNRMKNFCGWSSERDTSRGVSGIISHTGDSVEVRGYSTLNESTGNESWGLDNVAVWVK